MICCIFPWVERSLVFCVICFRMCNTLWYIVLYVSACLMRSDIQCYIFLHVECALVICVKFSTCGTLSGMLSFIFMPVEFILVFCVIYFCIWNALWYFMLHFSMRETRSGIVEFRVKIFRVCNALWDFVLFIFLLFSSFRVELYLP